MKRITGVFEYEGEFAPAVCAKDEWKGGKLVAVSFTDALAENDKMRGLLESSSSMMVGMAMDNCIPRDTRKVLLEKSVEIDKEVAP